MKSIVKDGRPAASLKRVSKRFGTLFRKLGVNEPNRKVFHSFRTNVVTALVRAEVQEAYIQELIGHEQGTFTREKYYGGATLEDLKSAVDSISYPGLDLSNLRAPPR